MEAGRGARERRKSATRQALHDAAMRLAMDLGPDRVTVEAIADAANVSRRTFSNYFSGKEEALLHGDHVRMRRLLELIAARPAAESPWSALTAAVADFLGELGDRDPRWVAQARLVRTHPSLVVRQVTAFARWEREIAEHVLARSGPGGTEMRARIMAATFLAAFRIAVATWIEHPAGTPLPALVGQALHDAGAAFA